MRRERKAAALAAALLAAAVSISCGAGRAASERMAREPVRLDPIHVTATRTGDGLVVDAYDAKTLFERAVAALEEKRYDDAARANAALVAEFPNSELVAPALYNEGLALDALGRFGEAATAYRAFVDRYPESADVEDALFRLAGSCEHGAAWEEALRALEALAARRTISGVERVEVLARKGSALLELGRPADARVALEEAARLFRVGQGISPSDPVYYYSMAQFKLGELVHNEMRAIELPVDEAQLAIRLEEKARLLLEAQRLYTKVIRIGHADWAAAAAYRIGALYHHLWKDILAAPPPPGLDAEAAEIYFEILHEKIRGLLKKAVLQWERTLKLARRLELDNEWIDSTTRDLEEIRRELALEESGGSSAGGDDDDGEKGSGADAGP